MKIRLLTALMAFSLLPPLAQASSDSWILSPVNNDWNTPTNWSFNTVPGGSDTATFAVSNITDISISAQNSLFSIEFNAGASAYSLTALPGDSLSIGNGVIYNLSGVEQNFAAQTDDAGQAGSFVFSGSSSAGQNVVFTQYGSTVPGVQGGAVYFSSALFSASAGSGIFHNLAGTTNGALGGVVVFTFHADAAESTIINEGGQVSGAAGGGTMFERNSPGAGNATLIANEGSNGGGGGFIEFRDGSTGGTARVEVFGNGYMDLSGRSAPSLFIGSIEGDGQIYLSKTVLKVGMNNLSTTFSGVLHPGSPGGGSGTGALTKLGSGTLTLTGASLYTDGTTINGGTLVVNNTAGSGTGTGAVGVTSGTLGGSGIIAGAVTVGTGSGSGAVLAPAYGGNKQLTLTIQSSLTFNSDATYTYTFKAKGNKSKIDKVIANGVTINSGASVNLSGTTQGQMSQGSVLTLIKNTAATPISGIFSNLADGGIVNVNGNNLQASYEGGDGNDLTLTVVH